MPRVVISDTSPIRYLTLIGEADLLPALYVDVFVPKSVADELVQPATPESVRRWMADQTPWLQVVPVTPAPSNSSRKNGSARHLSTDDEGLPADVR